MAPGKVGGLQGWGSGSASPELHAASLLRIKMQMRACLLGADSGTPKSRRINRGQSGRGAEREESV